MKNVLFFPVWTVAPHFETDLELILHEINLGNKVNIVSCQKDLRICDNNLKGDKKRCEECIRIRRKAIKIIHKDVKTIPLKEIFQNLNNHIYNINTINSVNELTNLYYESFDIGFGIASSLANEIDSIDFKVLKDKIIVYYLETIKFYESVKQIALDFNINHGYIFNGRFALSRAFFRALEAKNVSIVTHERGATFKKYSLIENALPHDIKKYTERVNILWEKEKNFFEKKQIARIFFESRYDGKDTGWVSFTKTHIKGKLPEEIKYYKKIVTIFNSSAFEYDYISQEYTYKFYLSQNDGITQIVKSLEDKPDIGVFLREHPNLKNYENFQRKEIRSIKAKNFYLIPAESDINSYSLLLRSNIVVTFNSTMGIEATYWGIPSILCSNAIYERFDIAYQPSTHDEVIKLILSDLKPIKSIDVLKIGYYNSIDGIDFKYYRPIDFFNGIFLEKNLHETHFFLVLLRKLKKRIKFWIKNIYNLLPHHHV